MGLYVRQKTEALPQRDLKYPIANTIASNINNTAIQTTDAVCSR